MQKKVGNTGLDLTDMALKGFEMRSTGLVNSGAILQARQ
jgi:hypothetical protein